MQRRRRAASQRGHLVPGDFIRTGVSPWQLRGAAPGAPCSWRCWRRRPAPLMPGTRSPLVRAPLPPPPRVCSLRTGQRRRRLPPAPRDISVVALAWCANTLSLPAGSGAGGRARRAPHSPYQGHARARCPLHAAPWSSCAQACRARPGALRPGERGSMSCSSGRQCMRLPTGRPAPAAPSPDAVSAPLRSMRGPDRPARRPRRQMLSGSRPARQRLTPALPEAHAPPAPAACAGEAGTGPVVPPVGYTYEAQVEFVDHVTPPNTRGSLAASAIQEVRAAAGKRRASLCADRRPLLCVSLLPHRSSVGKP